MSPESSREPGEAELAAPPGQDWGPWAPSQTWRVGALIRIQQLRGLLRWLETRDPDMAGNPTDQFIRTSLASAQRAVEQSDRLWRRRSGNQLAEALAHTSRAESLILHLTPDEYVVGELPSLAAYVERNLPVSDPRRIRVEQLYARMLSLSNEGSVHVSPEDRANLIAATAEANMAMAARQFRLARFRTVLFLATLLVAVVAAAVATIGFLAPESIPLCFTPEQRGLLVVACPLDQSAPLPSLEVDVRTVINETVSPADLLVVELVGLISATLGAVLSLRHLRGGPGPYRLALPLALIKLPMGSLTAVLGLLFLSAGLVLGLTNVDSSSQILAWAAVLGFAQQLFTRHVDIRGRLLLEEAGGEVSRFEEAETARESMLHQVSLAVPAISPQLQETLIESVLGPPTPPYDGFVAIESHGGVRNLAAHPGVSKTVSVWFQTSKPQTDVHSAIRVKGFRWEENAPVSTENPPTIKFEVQLHVPDHPDTPFGQTISAPIIGQSKQAVFVLDLNRASSSSFETFVEVSHRGRVIQIIDITTEAA